MHVTIAGQSVRLVREITLKATVSRVYLVCLSRAGSDDKTHV